MNPWSDGADDLPDYDDDPPWDMDTDGDETPSDAAFADRDTADRDTAPVDVPPNAEASIERTLALLSVGGPLEIRVLQSDGQMRVRRFDRCDAAAAFVRTHDRTARGIYTPINPFDPAKITGAAVTDASVTVRHWMLIDCDPARPTGTNAADEELRRAVDVAREVAAYLIGVHHWPEDAFVRAGSGNGGHLLVRIHLPNDEESRQLVEAVLAHLASRFDSAHVEIDTGVFNASRITKLYGTMTRKGAATPDRPHRRSFLVDVPAQIVPVSKDRLESVAPRVSATTTGPQHDPQEDPQDPQHDPPDAPPVAHPVKSRDACLHLAATFLATHPVAVEGDHGDLHTFQTCAAVVRGYDLTDDEALTVLRPWNARCTPPWDEHALKAKIHSAAKYGDEPRAGRLAWQRHKKGPLKGAIIASSQHNIRVGLACLDLTFRYNAFANVTLACHGGDEQPIDDAVLHRAYLQLDTRFHFKPPLDFFQMVVFDWARHFTFHPVRDYLDGLRWDRVPRLDQWLVTYAGAADSAYARAIGAKFFLAAIRRVRSPGVKFDTIPILESPQGLKKSIAVRTLCPNAAWFTDDLPLGTDAKLTIERTGGKWIIEVGEMQGYSNADIEKLKAFCSRGTDGPVRMSYARIPIEQPRQFVLVGTTNELTQYLQDSTGNRRFWPVRVNRFDVEALRRDRDQLWAEASYREALGEPVELAEALWSVAASEQEARRLTDPFEESIEEAGIDLTDKKVEAILVSTLWGAVVPLAGTSRKKNDASRIAKIMQRHGFTRRKKINVIPVVNGREQRQCDPERRTAWIRDGADPTEIVDGSVRSADPMDVRGMY